MKRYLLFPLIISFILASANTFAQSTPPQPIASYCFSNNAFVDEINNNSAIIYSGSSFGSYSKESLYLDGIEDYVELSPLDYSKEKNQCISLWIKMDRPDQEFNLISFANSEKFPLNQYELFYKNGNLFYLVRNIYQKEDILKTRLEFPIRRWMHICAQKSEEGIMQIFIDGKEVANKTATIGFVSLDNEPKLSVGARQIKNKFSGYLNAHINHISFYNQQLSNEDIYQIYKNGINKEIFITLDEKALIADTLGFVAKREEIEFIDYYYDSKQSKLYLLDQHQIHTVDMSLNSGDFQIESIPHHCESNISKHSFFKLNNDASLMSIAAKNHEIIVFNLKEKRIHSTIKIKPAFRNYTTALKDSSLLNPFTFVSNHELLVGGSFNAQIYNLVNQKTEKIKLKDEYPCIEVCSNWTITKQSEDGFPIQMNLKDKIYCKKISWDDHYGVHSICENGYQQQEQEFNNLESVFYLNDSIALKLHIEGIKEIITLNKNDLSLAILNNNKGFMVLKNDMKWAISDQQIQQEINAIDFKITDAKKEELTSVLLQIKSQESNSLVNY